MRLASAVQTKSPGKNGIHAALSTVALRTHGTMTTLGQFKHQTTGA